MRNPAAKAAIPSCNLYSLAGVVFGTLILTNGLTYLFGIFGLWSKAEIGLQLSDAPLAISALEVNHAQKPVRFRYVVAADRNRAREMSLGLVKTAKIGERLTKV